MQDKPGFTFQVAPAWQKFWQGMPEYNQEDQTSDNTLIVHFKNQEDRQLFAKLIDQSITEKTKSIWYPKVKRFDACKYRYTSTIKHNPKYPVYIISKGRWESRLTSKELERLKIPYRIVIEPQEYEQYAAVINSKKILVLPFSNLGKGSIPARNWVWEHSITEGAEWHWILDDNIRTFYRLNNNLELKVTGGSIFRAAEDFVNRYENIGQAGFQYFMFAPRKKVFPPFTLNTRIYSCILIRNDLPFRWRGRYNEDTDLSIRILKSRLCTILFCAFLAEKMPTLTMKGGNTDQLYQGDGRLKMAQSLIAQHPDIVTLTEKWGRPQHQVNYNGFKQRLILRTGVKIPEGINNYGMELQRVHE